MINTNLQVISTSDNPLIDTKSHVYLPRYFWHPSSKFKLIIKHIILTSNFKIFTYFSKNEDVNACLSITSSVIKPESGLVGSFEIRRTVLWSGPSDSIVSMCNQPIINPPELSDFRKPVEPILSKPDGSHIII